MHPIHISNPFTEHAEFPQLRLIMALCCALRERVHTSFDSKYYDVLRALFLLPRCIHGKLDRLNRCAPARQPTAYAFVRDAFGIIRSYSGKSNAAPLCPREFRMRRRRWSINSQSQSPRHVSPFRDETEQNAFESVMACATPLLAVSAPICSHPYGAIDLTSCKVAVIRMHFLPFLSLSLALCLAWQTNRNQPNRRQNEKKATEWGKISFPWHRLVFVRSFTSCRAAALAKNKLFSMGPIVVIAHCILQLVFRFSLHFAAFAPASTYICPRPINEQIKLLNKNDETNWRMNMIRCWPFSFDFIAESIWLWTRANTQTI